MDLVRFSVRRITSVDGSRRPIKLPIVLDSQRIIATLGSASIFGHFFTDLILGQR